jgi:hypothetical protein
LETAKPLLQFFRSRPSHFSLTRALTPCHTHRRRRLLAACPIAATSLPLTRLHLLARLLPTPRPIARPPQPSHRRPATRGPPLPAPRRSATRGPPHGHQRPEGQRLATSAPRAATRSPRRPSPEATAVGQPLHRHVLQRGFNPPLKFCSWNKKFECWNELL